MCKNTPKWGLVSLALGPDGHLIRHAGCLLVIVIQKWAKNDDWFGVLYYLLILLSIAPLLTHGSK